MIRAPKPLILVILMGGLAAAGFGPATVPEPTLLRDGFSLAGVDGKLIGSDSNGAWFLELSEDVNDDRALAKAGMKLELLPSSTLEKMIADAKTRSAPTYRLWNAEVTKYKGRNFIFPRYFLPLAEAKRPASEASPQPGEPEQGPPTDTAPELEREPEVAIDEPNDILAMPPEIIKRLKARREGRTTTSLRQIADSNELPAARRYARGVDSVFVDRTAFLVKQDDGGFAFVPDALGRNVQQLSLRLLPCEVLELAERRRSVELEPLRFKIAGIMTKYNGKTYLLLQKAARAYGHGNFGR